MRAVVCPSYGPVSSLRVRQVERPRPAADQVLVRVAAAGVNFPDGLMVRGEYQTAMTPPFVPGSEVAGVVAEVGEAVTALAPGTRVVGFCGTGGYAEYALANAAQVVQLPASVPYRQAAGLTVVYSTALHGLVDRAGLAAGQTLLVLGAAGGVGLAAVQLGRLLGATVIAAASTPDKRALCERNGAQHTLDYTTGSLRDDCRALTDGRGIDVVFDAVGGPVAAAAVRSLAWGGRYLVVGFASGEIPSLAFNRLLLNSGSLLGVLWGQWARRNPELNRANLTRLLGWAATGELAVHLDGRFDLDGAVAALELVMDRRVTGKAVIDVNLEA